MFAVMMTVWRGKGNVTMVLLLKGKRVSAYVMQVAVNFECAKFEF